MGVAADLGYQHRKPGAIRMSMQRLGSTKVGAWGFSKTLMPSDRLIRRLSKRR